LSRGERLVVLRRKNCRRRIRDPSRGGAGSVLTGGRASLWKGRNLLWLQKKGLLDHEKAN